MGPGHSTTGTTRLDDQHQDVFPSSPNALVAVFVAVLQARFFEQGGDPPLPWFWDPAPTPTTDDGGGLPEDPSGDSPPGRRIYIEQGPLDFPQARDLRPALIVTRGPLQYTTLGVGRSPHIEYPTMGRLLLCHGLTSVSIACVSRESGESGTLADVVASYLYASASELRAEFGIHHIGDPVISPPAPYARAQGAIPAWSTEVAAPVEVIYKWYKWPLAPIIREFRMRLVADGEATDLREVLQRRAP